MIPRFIHLRAKKLTVGTAKNGWKSQFQFRIGIAFKNSSLGKKTILAMSQNTGYAT
jgi:hypothetical protein